MSSFVDFRVNWICFWQTFPWRNDAWSVYWISHRQLLLKLFKIYFKNGKYIINDLDERFLSIVALTDSPSNLTLRTLCILESCIKIKINKAFIKPFEALQRSVKKYKFQLNFSLCSGSWWEKLTCLKHFECHKKLVWNYFHYTMQ